MIDQQIVQKAVDQLFLSAPLGSKVILFGSYARGNVHPESDLDFLVVEPQVEDRLREMFRLRRSLEAVLGPYLVPVDLVVMSKERFERTRNTPNTLAYEAAKGGQIYERNI